MSEPVFKKVKTELVVSGVGNREIVKDAEFLELVQSVKDHGVLEPLLVRLDHGDVYQVIAGDRRLAAAKAAKVEEIPVMVHVADDDVLEQLRAIENLQRKDLDPMQEAAAIERVRVRVGDSKTAAALMRKTVAYVTRAVALLGLPKEVTTLIAAGELSAEHGHQLVRAEGKAQPELIKFVTTRDWAKKFPSLDDLKKKMADKVENDLKKAGFVKDEAYAGMVACTECPLNSANQANLFDGAGDGVCTGPSCFSKKERQFYKDFAETHGKKLEAFRFLGNATDSGQDAFGPQTLKGFALLDEEALGSKLIKAAMEKTPAAFGWAVMKPGKYSDRKKPWIGFFLIDPEVLPKEKRPKVPAPRGQDGRDWEAEQKRNAHFQTVKAFRLLEAADKAFDGEKPKQRHLVMLAWKVAGNGPAGMVRLLTVMGMIKEGDAVLTEKGVANVVDKLKPSALMRIIWLAHFQTWNLDKILREEVGIETAKIVKAADAEALALWEGMTAGSTEKGDKKEPVDTSDKKKK